MDINILRVLCSQVGPCQVFPVPKASQLMVRYGNRDDVVRAQKHISGRQLGNAKVIADVVVDPNVLQMLDSFVGGGAGGGGAPPGLAPAGAPSSWNMLPSGGSNIAGGWGTQAGGVPGGGAGAVWASPRATGAWSAQDTSAMLSGDLFGGH